MNLSGSKTEKNLLKTFAHESRALTKYSLFAEKALEEGLEDIAEDFVEIAKEDFAHARAVFNRYLGLVKDTKQNIMNSINTEDEASRLYMKFAEDALEEGLEDIADFFERLAKLKKEHREELRESKEDIKDELYDDYESGDFRNSKKRRRRRRRPYNRPGFDWWYLYYPYWFPRNFFEMTKIEDETKLDENAFWG